jgi:hypothetical protein
VIVHAIQARATNDRRAYAVHLPLLLYLACVTALLGLFASIIYGQMQPTIIPNLGLAGYKAAGPGSLFLHKPDLSAEEMEGAAIDAAETENRTQGIDPLRAFAVEPAAARPRESTPPKIATARPAKPAKPKPKRVARQDAVADPWRSSWNRHSWEQERRWNNRAEPTRGRSLWPF